MATYISLIKTSLTLSPRPVLEWVHADTCLSGYWSGHHLPHVQIAVWRGMTLKQIKEAIRRELREGAVAGSCDAARLLSADMVRPCEEKQADALTRAAYAAVNKIKPAVKGQRRFFTDLEDSDDSDDGETVWAFFVLRDQE